MKFLLFTDCCVKHNGIYECNLEINGETLPFPTSYDVDHTDVEADSSRETEACIKQRDLIRQDVATITVLFSVSKRWLEKMSRYRNLPRLTVKYFSPDTLQYKQAQMYIDGYKAKLEHDTSYKGLWTVSFTLHEI